jgi:hypothetical protein
MLRCYGLARIGGYVGIVTQRGWLTQKNYAKLREQFVKAADLRAVADLGPGAFEEVGGENVSVALSILRRTVRPESDTLWVGDYTDYASTDEKAHELRRSSNRFPVSLSVIARLEKKQIFPGLPERLVALIADSPRLRRQAEAEAGLWTGDDARFTRWFWEASPGTGWKPLGKGGAFRRWYGLLQHVVRWEYGGASIKQLVCEKFPYIKGNYEWVVKNEGSYFLPGAAYSFSASASLGVRVWQPGCIFSGLAPYIAISPSAGPIMAGILSSRLYTLFLRSLADKLRLRADYVNDLPEVPDSLLRNTELAEYALWCISSSQARARIDPVESDFHPLVLPKTHQEYFSYVYPYDVIRLLIQERFENAVGIAFNLGSHERQVLDRKNGLFISFGTWVRWSTR